MELKEQRSTLRASQHVWTALAQFRVFKVVWSCRIEIDARIWMMAALGAPGLCRTLNRLHAIAAIRPVCPKLPSTDPQQRRNLKGFLDRAGQQPTELAWVLVSSHNFGPSPWGDLQKAQTQLMIRSYELGVLVTPETELAAQVAVGTSTGNATSVRLLQGVAGPSAPTSAVPDHRDAGQVRASDLPS